MGARQIARLIDRVQEATASPENQARIGRMNYPRRPNVQFSFEEPMTWVRLWHLDVDRYYSDPFYYIEKTLEQKLWRWENFPGDNLPITAEIPASLSMYPEYTFMGMDLFFSPEGIPTIQADHPLTHTPDLRLLKPVDFKTSGWMPRLLHWWEDLNHIVAGRLQVVNAMTWWRGCLDLAIQLRRYDQLMLDIVERPVFVHALLNFLTEQRCLWWEAYTNHFNLPLLPGDIGEDWLNVPFISPAFFSDFVLPCYLEIERFHGSINSLHSCGNQEPLQRYFLEIKSLSNYEVSPWTSLEKSLINLPLDKKLAIGLHPNDVLFATPQEMAFRLEYIRDTCDGRRYMIGTSGLTPILGSPEAFIHQLNVWLSIVHKTFDQQL
jgi:hypothetical protein